MIAQAYESRIRQKQMNCRLTGGNYRLKQEIIATYQGST